jgi:hypothetical protein
MTAESKRAKAEYERLLKSLDTQSRQVISAHLERLSQMIDDGGISVMDIKHLSEELQKGFHDIIKDNSILAIDFAKKVKAADFRPFMVEVQRLSNAQKLAPSVIKEITSLARVSPVFGGGLDKDILNAVWNKAWPDALKVDDRINVLSKKMMQYVETTVKQGISEGKSSYNIYKDLKQHLLVEGKERQALYRLAVHTTNSCYQQAQAEISIQANFVMGIRITRAVDGSETCDICAEHGGEVGGDGKEYFKDDFGGRSYDLYVMANAPGFHPNCRCEVEDIVEDASTFVQNALREYKNK